MGNRAEIINKIEAMARGTDGVTALISMGDGVLPNHVINLGIVAASEGDVAKIFRMFNFKLTEELAPESSSTLRRDDKISIKEYKLPGGASVTILFCAPQNLFSAPWWRPVFDNDGAASNVMGESTRVAEDKIAGGEASSGGSAPEPNPESAKASRFGSRKTDDSSNAKAVATPVSDNEWERVASLLRNAKRAVSSESYIWAAEVLADLRKIMIEKMCIQNGITENFASSINYLPKDALQKLERTYPSSLERGTLISALAAAEEFLMNN